MGLAGTVVKEICQELDTKTREFYEFVLPPADILQTDSEFVVIVDVPGFSREAIDVRLDANILRIRAEKKEDEDGADRLISAQRPRMLDKKIRLPADAQDLAESVGSARYDEGVLTVSVPRRTRGQNIPVV